MTAHRLSLPAHAKLNLFLRVLGRESDGFHGIETLFCLVSLADTVTVERREGRGVTVEVIGADVGPPEQNLAVRAATMVLEATGHRLAARSNVEIVMFRAASSFLTPLLVLLSAWRIVPP